jgi:hypothetical protein
MTAMTAARRRSRSSSGMSGALPTPYSSFSDMRALKRSIAASLNDGAPVIFGRMPSWTWDALSMSPVSVRYMSANTRLRLVCRFRIAPIRYRRGVKADLVPRGSRSRPALSSPPAS